MVDRKVDRMAAGNMVDNMADKKVVAKDSKDTLNHLFHEQ
jgi:hypothetical protein